MSKNTLSSLIDKHQSQIIDDVREYIGASSIGSDCLRKIWYQYKGMKSEGIASKTRRIWDVGKKLEELLIDWLIKSGVKVVTYDVTYSSEKVPIFQGHIDALVELNNKNYILEIKTAKNASFNIFVKKGVKSWNPQYYAQVQSYMGMSGIFSTYILVLNKDNSDISDELVTFDSDFYDSLEKKALGISKSVSEPPKINGSPLWYQCKMCSYNKICHN
jgi:Domain of unknown function DUF83